MISGFACKATEELFHGRSTKRTRRLLPPQLVQAAVDMLDLMNIAASLKDLRSPPANRLEKLVGDLEGFHSVRLNKRYRIIFSWTDSGPADVRIDDHTY